MFLLLLVFTTVLAIIPNFFGPQVSSLGTGTSDSSPWYDQPLCFLLAASSCPSGFKYEELRLSVQPDVNPKDKNAAGQDLMHLGDAGASSLTHDTYDRLYTLTLAVCCRH